jgi:hypothetical protein
MRETLRRTAGFAGPRAAGLATAVHPTPMAAAGAATTSAEISGTTSARTCPAPHARTAHRPPSARAAAQDPTGPSVTGA